MQYKISPCLALSFLFLVKPVSLSNVVGNRTDWISDFSRRYRKWRMYVERMTAGGDKSREPEEAKNRVSEAEDKSLLARGRCQKSRDRKKTRRKVQWRDHSGNKLVEVLEFQPSDESDSEVEDKDACRCSIM